MHFRLRTLTLASIAIAALGLASVVTPVQPAETAKKPRHCVKSLSKPDTRTACYDNFTAAIAAATGGRITDAPADVRVAMNDQRLLAKLNATGEKKDTAAIPSAVEAPISTLFIDDGFDDDSLTYIGTACTGPVSDIDFAEPYVGDEWNDDFESIRTFNNCFARLWEHRDFKGAMLDFFGDRSDLGVLNDEVSSVQWS